MPSTLSTTIISTLMALVAAPGLALADKGELDRATSSSPAADAGAALELVASIDPSYDPLFDEDFEDSLDLHEDPDPLEGLNRTFFSFNRWVEGIFFQPITKAYRFAVPEPGRKALHRVFRNAGSPPILVNDLLQLRFRAAGETFGRFILNSSLGMGGLFDAGAEAGWEFHDSDFGQTMALYGVPSGPYLVAPIFGPTTLRDGAGAIVDRGFDPLTYVFGLGIIGPTIQVAVGAGTGITAYEAVADDIEALEDGSLDFYSALRSVYIQDREAQIEETHLSSAVPYLSALVFED